MKKHLENYKIRRKETFNIVIFSVLLSTIINIVTNSFCELFNINHLGCIIVGCIAILVLIMTSRIYEIYKLNEKIEYKGVFIIDSQNKNQIVKIPNYEINNDMCNYIESAFAENLAMKKIWETGNFRGFVMDSVDKDGNIFVKCDDTVNLLIELLEYSILHKLSVFVTDYFNLLHLQSKVIKWSKDSIPDVLFSNRFLKLFSEEMNNRNAFIEREEENEDSHTKGETVMAIGKNGALYSKFDLCLPKGARIQKNEKNSITIDTSLFVLTIEYLYGGFSTVLPNGFYEYYLGKQWDMNYRSYQFNINVSVRYKLTSVCKIFDWKYYNWLDKFIDTLEHYCNKQTFLTDIGWKENQTIIRLFENKREV